ncbi:MAG: VPDSG-CTERM sorting domain-containing protein [Verrucomicrobiales bacterium]
MIKAIISLSSALTVLIGGLLPSQAAVTGGSVTLGGGDFVLLSSFTGSVGRNNFNDLNLYAFDEIQNLDSGAGGIDVNLGSVPANTTVASHYVFFDPRRSSRQIGWVEFDGDILGVATDRANLAASDQLFDHAGVNYLNHRLRGLESRRDTVTIGSGVQSNRLFVNWRASSPGDYVRVFTAVPSPATSATAQVPDGGSMAFLLGGSLLGLAGARRWIGRR